MKVFWENDDPTKGDCVAVIDLEDGGGIQRFKGATEKIVADKLLQAQGNASQKIREMAKSLPLPAQPAARKPIQPRQLTADERFTMAQAMNDPTKAPEAIAQVVEAAVGAPLATISKRFRDEDERDAAESARKEAIAFAQETPDYVSCKHNAETIAEFLQLHRLVPNKQNYAYAFEQLKAAGLVVVKPEADEEEVEAQPAGGLPDGSTTRPRVASSSTGLRSGDSSGVQGARRSTPTKYTLEQIESMASDEYKRRLQGETGFARIVEELYAGHR